MAALPEDRDFFGWVQVSARGECDSTDDALPAACLRTVDDALQVFLLDLSTHGILEDTHVMVTGDPRGTPPAVADGEDDALGRPGHRVPWIVLPAGPPLHGGPVETPVGLVDFPNTVLAMLGAAERLGGEGVAVFPDPPPGRAFAGWDGDLARWSLVDGPLQLLEATPGGTPERTLDTRPDGRGTGPIGSAGSRFALQERLDEAKARLLADRDREAR